MTSPAPLSYSHGTSPQPLLGETIGANLRRIAAAHGGREALVDVPSGRRWTYAEFDADTDTLARGLIAAGMKAGDRVGIWAPNCPEWVLLQYATAKAGVILVNINPAYRSHELGYVLRQSGVRLLVSAESFKSSNYRAMVEDVSGDLPDLQRVIYLGSVDWDELFVVGAMPVAGGEDQLAEREAVLGFDDAHQHPVHQRHDGVPEGRHAVPSQHPEQRVLHRGGLPVHGSGPGLHPGALLSLLRHGAGQPGLHDARLGDHHSLPRVRSRREPAGRRGRAVHVAVRGADHVHRRAGAARFRRPMTCPPSGPASWPARRARSR